MIPVIFLESGVVVCLLLSATALVIAIVYAKRSQQQLQASAELMEKISRDLAVANAGAVGMGQRLIALEKRLREQEAQPSLQPVDDYSGDDEFRTYTEAVRLFRSGLSSEEVARRCGLSRAEASLMEVMQQAGG